ncbi:uncharacterized protein MYCGRDRAFT_96713 [Zymoseptoria tritici IPO323]|uniref:Uncharacterized protein n=1 Tax=Zymoseptoria tritici (strain CBS 115943 / IPO323) TaxID=336722 RepID=F9XN95_ZYMTI|nr:uncharacterized protein MYCGRDRAFT_96713 [Zymoseptoria tritici IPO323]EGP83554.1 hypothetical protein MYCGRDRAFT_96713 [Zymoseptoria tritici IPO323]
MPSNKDRIYIALYARGGEPQMPGLEDKYHWGIIVGPKSDASDAQGRRFHAKEQMTINDGRAESSWQFEERAISMAPTAMILVRVVVGKVANTKRMQDVLESTPIRGAEPGWNCVAWVQEALERLQADGKALGTSATDWKSVRDAAMNYVEHKKAQHRFDGNGQFDNTKVPTWDLIEGVEVFP